MCTVLADLIGGQRVIGTVFSYSGGRSQSKHRQVLTRERAGAEEGGGRFAERKHKLRSIELDALAEQGSSHMARFDPLYLSVPRKEMARVT